MKLRIEKPIYGGAGLARAEGKAIFVPMTLPGEHVDAAIRRDRGSFSEADLLAVLEPSPNRVPASCPYYGACGGCQYQHAGYDAQLAMKRAILLETLERAGLRELPEIRIHSGDPWNYRNRVRLHVDPETHALGYRRRSSHALLPVETCPIAAPSLQAALRVLAAIFAHARAGAWCGEVELFTNQDSSALLLSLRMREGAQASGALLKQICEQAREQLPELLGGGLFHAAARGPRGRKPPPHALADEPDGESASGPLLAGWSEQALTYEVLGEPYRVSTGAFFQGNRFLVDTLARLATGENGTASRVAWDLFAGVGLFARVLAGRFDQVVAVEGSPVSARDLRHNLPGHRVVESSTQAFLSGLVNPKIRPDLVLLDPPRAGLGLQATSLLASIHSRCITYVSCDPATLARDLRVLVHAGYTLSRLDLVDMFPQTFHLETVAKLRLR